MSSAKLLFCVLVSKGLSADTLHAVVTPNGAAEFIDKKEDAVPEMRRRVDEEENAVLKMRRRVDEEDAVPKMRRRADEEESAVLKMRRRVGEDAVPKKRRHADEGNKSERHAHVQRHKDAHQARRPMDKYPEEVVEGKAEVIDDNENLTRLRSSGLVERFVADSREPLGFAIQVADMGGAGTSSNIRIEVCGFTYNHDHVCNGVEWDHSTSHLVTLVEGFADSWNDGGFKRGEWYRAYDYSMVFPLSFKLRTDGSDALAIDFAGSWWGTSFNHNPYLDYWGIKSNKYSYSLSTDTDDAFGSWATRSYACLEFYTFSGVFPC